MKKIIYFTKYTNLGASSRLRSIQYFPLLEEKGYKVLHKPLFSDNYLKALYKGSKMKFVYLIIAYFKRMFDLLELRKNYIIVIEKELFPFIPPFVEIGLRKLGYKYYVDYDDAIFHNYDLSTNPLIKKLLSDKIDRIMNNSYLVFAGNSYLEERAKKAQADQVVILPTVIDNKKYYKIENKNAEEFTIGWIGSPSTFKYIQKLFPVFYQLKEKYPHLRVNIIGAKQEASTQDFINFIPWQEATEVDELNKFDVGLMPLDLSPWEFGKCSYKLIQYMGCHIAVLASPVGMNNDVVIPDYNGQLAEENEWYNKIEKYIIDKNLTVLHGNNGRKLIDSKYNLKNNSKIIIDCFEN